MATIQDVKQRPLTETPLLLFRCELTNGEVRRWCTHNATVAGETYEARVRQHNLFEMRALGEDGADGLGKVVIRLSDVDGTLVQLERSAGFKGAKLRIDFVFFDLNAASAVTDPITLFLGMANPPEEITESDIRLGFVNRMNMQRSYLPALRIQRRCPWTFPSTPEQRALAADNSDLYQRWNRCGYSPDVPGGVGNLNGTVPYTSCDYSRAQCEERGMFASDAAGRSTRRFAGMDFVPASILVRSYGDAGTHTAYTLENEARFNDVVPLVYGSAWYYPPVIFARNDGNLMHLEVLLGSGVIDGVEKVIVNDVEISSGASSSANAATGWYNLVSRGEQAGAFNQDFSDAQNRPLGDPYGSMAVLSVVVPNRLISSGRIPKVRVFLKGMRLPAYSVDGSLAGTAFTNNPAWVLLDVLRRSGWQLSEIDLASFARVAASCDEQVAVLDLQGQPVFRPKFQCNFVVRKRTSTSELVRGIGSGSGLSLAFGTGGKLILKLEGTLAAQQPEKPAGSNSLAALAGGWPAYEFGDGTDGWSDILRRANGEPSLRFSSRGTAELPNRYSIEFQDELNGYQQDSLSLVDSQDVSTTSQEISSTLPAIGIANYRQAAQVIGIRLRKSLYGNLFAEFETSCRGLGLNPGDIITITYPRLGLNRQSFRVVNLSPGLNFGSVAITAQIHDDQWYLAPVIDAYGGGGQPGAFAPGLPRPLLGALIDETVRMQWRVQAAGSDDIASTIRVTAAFTAPAEPSVTGLRTPTISTTPGVNSGGSLSGGQHLYYAVSGVDENGVEGPLSACVSVDLPAGSGGSSVRLNGLSFGPSANGFRVYRGGSSQSLLLIGESSTVADSFTDNGATASLQGPPDFNFDHANFYWRWESIPPTAATAWSGNSITSNTLALTPDAYKGQVVRIVQGTGVGQERVISGNTENSITIQTSWTMAPDSSTMFAVAEASWRLGATTRTSPATWDMPYRAGATIHVLGRAANVGNLEDAYALAIQTRWQVGATGGADQGVPGRPVFGLTTQGRGTLDLSGIAFATLANTRTVTSGTLAVHYVDELDPATWSALATPLTAADETVPLAGVTVEAGNLLQIDREIMVVVSYDASLQRAQVSRGEKGSTADAHIIGTPIFVLKRKTVILPFAQGFFGSPVSGDFVHTISLPSARVAEADLFVTNRFGNSETGSVLFTETRDQGLRTLVGGQFSLTIEGLLGLQDDAALPVRLDQAYAVRNVYAFVTQAPTGSPLEARVKMNGGEYVTLSIPAGQTMSSVVSGFGKTPLPEGGNLGVDVTGVSTDPAEYPGRDLTIVVEV